MAIEGTNIVALRRQRPTAIEPPTKFAAGQPPGAADILSENASLFRARCLAFASGGMLSLKGQHSP